MLFAIPVMGIGVLDVRMEGKDNYGYGKDRLDFC